MTLLKTLHSDLLRTKELVYDIFGLEFKNIKLQSENTKYATCSFELNGNNIEHRCSKITPTKGGQFVTIWKRNTEGITTPFDISDRIDFIIITSRSGDNLGQFIFPIHILAEKGIVSRNAEGGKRGIRVYPPWDNPTSDQAVTTQEWQSEFFLQIKDTCSKDLLIQLLTKK